MIEIRHQNSKRPRNEQSKFSLKQLIRGINESSDEEDDVEQHKSSLIIEPLEKHNTVHSTPTVSNSTSVTNKSNPCWACSVHFGKGQVKSEFPVLDEMLGTFEANRDIPLEETCAILAAVYEAKILKPKLAQGSKDVVICLASDFLVHFTEHIIDPYRQIKQEIKGHNHYIKALESKIEQDGDFDLQLYDRLLKTRNEKLKAFMVLKHFN